MYKEKRKQSVNKEGKKCRNSECNEEAKVGLFCRYHTDPVKVTEFIFPSGVSAPIGKIIQYKYEDTKKDS